MFSRLLAALVMIACVAGGLVAFTANAQVGASGCPAPSDQRSGLVPFGYSSKPQYFTVPNEITELMVQAGGAHGGETSHTAPGGAGGQTDAVVPVTPGECLTVWVGQYTTGSGGNGYTKGGAHGTAGGDGGHDGGAGGGSSALLRGIVPLVVAGGGGGGGGDGESYGGSGGSGGRVAGAGSNGSGGPHARGGCGGCKILKSAGNGDKGSHAEDYCGNAGGGGGGGGGFRGAGGGEDGCFNAGKQGGGAGGGAGSSFITSSALKALFSTVGAPCRPSSPSTCHGFLELEWDPPGAESVPSEPAVRILSTNLEKAAKNGLPVSHAASGGMLSLKLTLVNGAPGGAQGAAEAGGNGNSRRTSTTVETSPTHDTVRLELPPQARRMVRRAGQGDDLRHVEFRLRTKHADGNAVQHVLLR